MQHNHGQKTLGEFSGNPDGSYSLVRMVQWLMEASTHKPMSEADAKALIFEARTKPVRQDGK